MIHESILLLTLCLEEGYFKWENDIDIIGKENNKETRKECMIQKHVAEYTLYHT